MRRIKDILRVGARIVPVGPTQLRKPKKTAATIRLSLKSQNTEDYIQPKNAISRPPETQRMVLAAILRCPERQYEMIPMPLSSSPYLCSSSPSGINFAPGMCPAPYSRSCLMSSSRNVTSVSPSRIFLAFRGASLFISSMEHFSFVYQTDACGIKTRAASSRSSMRSPLPSPPTIFNRAMISLSFPSSSICSVMNHWRKMFVA